MTTKFLIVICILFTLASTSFGGVPNSMVLCAENDTLAFTPYYAFGSAFGGGFVGLFAGGFAGYGIAYLSGERSSSEFGDLGFVIAILLGASAGVPVGASTNLYYASGKSCSLLPLFLAAAVPEIIVMYLGIATGHISTSPLMLVAGWVLAPIGAATYYTRCHSQNANVALLNISEKKANFALPQLDVRLSTNSGNSYIVPLKSTALECRINLLAVEF
ncbi:hypothetical protein GF337_16525 [candidate division KSB1 bacterium]|nr:hypothetical protein [candidate division KSB1 bacterium]